MYRSVKMRNMNRSVFANNQCEGNADFVETGACCALHGHTGSLDIAQMTRFVRIDIIV